MKQTSKVWNWCIKVWKKFLRYETNFGRYEKKLYGMKLFFREWKSTFWVWSKTNFWKFPISYPRVWKFRLFFPDAWHQRSETGPSPTPSMNHWGGERGARTEWWGSVGDLWDPRIIPLGQLGTQASLVPVGQTGSSDRSNCRCCPSLNFML